jgi:DNA repair protein RadD
VITLRPYQSDGIQKIRDAFAGGAKSPLYVLPTGGGKTVLFSAIAESSEKRGKRVLILAHRVELVDQIVTALKDFNVNPDIIAAGYARRNGGRRIQARSSQAVSVASVQTLARHLGEYPAPTMIICDEAHHCAVGNTWSAVMRYYHEAKVLGVTATPIRLDGHGLAAHFDRLIVGPSVKDLIADGYLVKPRVFAPPTVDTSGLHIRAGDFRQEESEALMDVPTITGDALEHYKKHAANRAALVFCTSVAHGHHVAERFRTDGIAAISLDGGTDKEVRRMAVQDFRDGKIQVLASCDLFSEGFDVPGVHVGILLRPTASEGLFRQQVGRILRPAPGKTEALILDHCNNTMKFGLPDENREWELTSDVVKRKKQAEASIRVCPKCFAASPSRSIVCAECGHVFEVQPRQNVQEKEGELVELTAEQIQRKRERQTQGMANSLAKLKEIERIKKYKPGWAEHIWNARQRKKA